MPDVTVRFVTHRSVYKVGDRVHVGPDATPIEGMIVAVLFEGLGKVSYKVHWWDDGMRRGEWFDDCELSLI